MSLVRRSGAIGARTDAVGQSRLLGGGEGCSTVARIAQGCEVWHKASRIGHSQGQAAGLLRVGIPQGLAGLGTGQTGDRRER